MPSTVEEMAAALISIFEGERLTAYRDSGGVLTIGIGHTGEDVTKGMAITHEQALELFRKDQIGLLFMVSGKPTIQAAALVSFGFNCGAGALRKVLAGADTISNPVHTMDRRGRVLPGLVARRRLEALLIEG